MTYYYCPICGEENPDSFFLDNGNVIGCSSCIDKVDAYEYYMEVRKDAEEFWSK